MRILTQAFTTLLLGFLLLSNVQAQKTTIPYKQFYGDLVKYSRTVKDKGKGEYVWVVHFWASWNTNSRQQIAPLQALYKSYLNRPVRIVSVSVDKVNGAWTTALRQHKMPWAQTRLPREDDYDFLKNAFRHNSLPAIFIVDERAKVRRMSDTKALVDYLQKILPNDKPVVTPTPDPKPDPVKPSPSGNGKWTYHTVAAGETLYSLFRRYGVKVDEIKRLNGLKSNNISIGQKLKIKKE